MDYYTPGQVAELLDIHPSTVRRWRQEGIGPKPFRTPGGWHRYLKEDFHAWCAEHWPQLEISA